jgi:hypothetical protein
LISNSITLLDQTSHYFGGYFHVKLLVYSDIPLDRSYFDSDSEFSIALEKLGATVRFERVLEKMAVPKAEIESVRTQLLKDFDETAKGYLTNADFAPRFVRSEYQKCVKKTPHSRTSRA